MLISEVPNIGLDDLLGYLDRTIKLNIDKEKKHELLRSKVNELKELFNKNNLSKLTRLKFVFTEEDLLPNINDLSIEEDIEEPIVEIVNQVETNKVGIISDKDEHLQLTEEDKEILAEEERAERNRKILENKKQNTSIKNISKKVELPPKHKVSIPSNERDEESNCLCGPDEACSKCLDSK
jgi:hypothetical protein